MGSGFKTFTAGAVLTASDMNNYLMEQSVMRFATTAARDVAITAPEDGMTVYIGSGDANEGLYTYNGTAWRLPWNMPWGRLASVDTNSTRQTITTAGTDVTGLSVTLNQVDNRVLKFTFMLGVLCVTAASTAFNLNISTGTSGAGTNIATLGETKKALTEYSVMTYVKSVTTTTTGSTSYHLRVASLSANGIAITNDLGVGHMIVEDIGPATTPV